MEQFDRTRLTLAQVVSWIAWGRSIPRTTFRLAFQADAERLSPQAASGRAELQAAAGGVEYGTPAFWHQLVAAETALFDAIMAGRLTCYAKVDERDEAWQRVPDDWFAPNDADPRPLVAALDSDWIDRDWDRIDRDGFPPLDHIFGPHARRNPNGWKAVQFERGELQTAFLPDVVKRWPASEPIGVEEAPEKHVVLTGKQSGTPRQRPTATPPTSRAKGGMGPTRQVSAALTRLGAKLAAEGAPEPRSGAQAHLERWFRAAVASLNGEISKGRARVHVRRAIKLYREEMAKDR